MQEAFILRRPRSGLGRTYGLKQKRADPKARPSPKRFDPKTERT
jgi:hypothetical protein